MRHAFFAQNHTSDLENLLISMFSKSSLELRLKLKTNKLQVLDKTNQQIFFRIEFDSLNNGSFIMLSDFDYENQANRKIIYSFDSNSNSYSMTVFPNLNNRVIDGVDCQSLNSYNSVENNIHYVYKGLLISNVHFSRGSIERKIYFEYDNNILLGFTIIDSKCGTTSWMIDSW